MAASFSEAEQLAALARGQAWAFDALYHRYRQPVYANICKLVRDAAAAEDLLQEVFIALWEHRQAFGPSQQVGGWLFVVSYNKAATYLKKRLRETTRLAAAPAAELAANLAAGEVPEEEWYAHHWALVEEAVGQLPARKQHVFRLCRFEGRPADEVAALVGISVASVKDYLKQATQFIRARVQRRPGPGRVAAGVGLALLGLVTIW